MVRLSHWRETRMQLNAFLDIHLVAEVNEFDLGINGGDRTLSLLVYAKDIPVKSHGFAVSLTVLAMKSRPHADYVISHAFQLKQNLRK